MVEEKALYFEGELGVEVREGPVPEEYLPELAKRKQELLEYVSNVDEELGEMFLEERLPSKEQLKRAIRRTTLAKTFTPVFVGSALKNKGVWDKR